MKRDLAGRCGMYCGVCEIHRGFKDAGKLRMDVAEKHRCLPADVRCNGCRAVHVVGWSRDENWGRNCKILRCLKSQNLDNCGDCKEASECGRLNSLASEYMGLGVDLKANLRAMQQLGIEGWLKSQEERWRCQQCSHTVVVTSITPRCHHCGSFQL